MLISGCATHLPNCTRTCARPGDGATLRSNVVPTNCVSQLTLSQRSQVPVRQSSLVGGPAGVRKSATQIGYREFLEARCLQNIFVLILSPRGSPIPGKDCQNISPYPVHSKMGLTRSTLGQSVHPTRSRFNLGNRLFHPGFRPTNRPPHPPCRIFNNNVQRDSKYIRRKSKRRRPVGKPKEDGRKLPRRRDSAIRLDIFIKVYFVV